MDVAVIGAGVGGIYAAHHARRNGYSVQGIEADTDVGGTWYRNRYPGARCDIESLEYSYGFNAELARRWRWSERFAGQPEILRYINFVVDELNVRPLFRFGAKVEQARFDEQSSRWMITGHDGLKLSARWLIAATGGHSVPRRPPITGEANFAGSMFHTAHWPEQFDPTGKRVALLGTGPSAIQCLPELADICQDVYVLQRTPNYVVPAQNGSVDKTIEQQSDSDHQAFRQICAAHPVGIGAGYSPSLGRSDVYGDSERHEEFERRWGRGGFTFVFAFDDMGASVDLARTAGDYVRRKILDTVTDSDVAAKLLPRHIFGSRRLCVGTDFYETFNRTNVHLIDLQSTALAGLTATAMHFQMPAGRHDPPTEVEIEAFIFATGFDDQTAALRKIDIRGRGGASLAQAWVDGPANYLGLMVAGFPNFFMVNGPGSPSITTNMITNAEHNVDWIVGCMRATDDQGSVTVEASREAQAEWERQVNLSASGSLVHCGSSRYVGMTAAGRSIVFPFLGVPNYQRLASDAANGHYRGCVFDNPTITTRQDQGSCVTYSYSSP